MTTEGQIEICEEQDKESSVRAQIIEKLSVEKNPITEREIEAAVCGRTA